MTSPARQSWPPKHAARALLGYLLDTQLSGATPASGMTLPSPWDAWWACYRAAQPLGALAADTGTSGPCLLCTRRASRLASSRPPGHPGTEPAPCGCLLEWAARMRAPGPRVSWPPITLTLALIKPGAPTAMILSHLARAGEVLDVIERTLTTADTRRMYPEAYGADYVRARDAYLTSGPSRILILHAPPGIDLGAIKAHIRAQAGADTLRNHLHMPDNPGEALADIAHFAGYEKLIQWHRRYERDHTTTRLAFYRAALGISPPRPDRVPAAG